MRRRVSIAWVVAFGLGGCSGGGSGSGTAPPQAIPLPADPSPSASARPSPSPSPSATASGAPEGAMSISFYIPIAGSKASSSRRRQFISAGAKSLLAIIDEPGIDQPALQHRMEPHDLVPDPITGLTKVTLYAPPGTVTLQLKLFTKPGALGFELARTDKKTITVVEDEDATPQPVDVTFNPIIAGVSFDTIATSTRTVNCDSSGALTIRLTSGKTFLRGYDAANELVEGAGRFLDSDGNDIKVTVGTYQGGMLGPYGPVYQPIAITTNPLTSPESSGTYSEQFAGAKNPLYVWALAISVGSSKVVGAGGLIFDDKFCDQQIGG